jgi:hypothetical protein
MATGVKNKFTIGCKAFLLVNFETAYIQSECGGACPEPVEGSHPVTKLRPVIG